MNLTQSERPDIKKAFEVPDALGPVRAWSYSALKVFEDCPYRTYIQRVRRVQEPSSPAAARGTDIHNEAEGYVNGEIGEFPPSLEKFKSEFEELRQLYIDAKVELEGEWGFNLEWAPVGWMGADTWARIKLDALVNESETSARVIDYKTGKKFGNEIAHSQQCLLYAIATFFRYPHLEFVQTELWYLDKGETTTKSYTRADAMQFAPGFHKRAITMTTCEDFAPTPSKQACRWCSFKNATDDEPAACQWGVT